MLHGLQANQHFAASLHGAGLADPMAAARALRSLAAFSRPDGFGFCGPQLRMAPQIGYAAMPDFSRSGHLAVDKKKGVVRTPGGYNVSVANGQVKIQSPNGKWSTLKAEPPGRTVTSSSTATQTRTQQTTERVLPRDPAVRESDGDVWRYQGTGTFQLPDGTKITIQEKGKDKGLHINQVDIYNGNKHVSVDSKLESANWKTVKRDVSTSATGWQTTSSNRRWQGRRLVRNDNQQRQVTTNVTEKQVADQKFKTTFSDVKLDGFRHDFNTKDGQKFRLGGDGDDWIQNGKEVISGAGKGKDDKTKAFQLGKKMDASWLGYRPLQVPWNVYAYQMSPAVQQFGGHHLGASAGHWGQLGSAYCGMQRSPYLGVQSQISNMGGFDSLYGGPLGGGALWGNGFAGGFNANAHFSAMNGSVGSMLDVFGGLGALQSDFGHQRRFAPLMV